MKSKEEIITELLVVASINGNAILMHDT